MRVVVIDDDPEVTQLVAKTLAMKGIETTIAASIRGGLAAVDTASPDCVLLDYRLPDGDGLGALRMLRHDFREVPVVIMTGHGSESVAVEAMKLGAADYLVKDEHWVDGVAVTVREVVGRLTLDAAARLHASARRDPPLARELAKGFRADGLIGQSGTLLETLRLADRAAHDAVAVLIHGETGTGKDLLARAIHRHGPRAARPFVSLNCAALSDTLLESELFGHVRGAFTGAVETRRGLFEEADGGTLFLDEIGEMSLSAQAKLLRVLEDGEVRPLGASATRRVDVRVVAASNRSLQQAAREGRFRLDLYYRLNAFPIRVPSLRERREDVPLLARHFLERACVTRGSNVPGFRPRTLQLLAAHGWPGNVRQLRNEVERLVILARPGRPIPPEGLSPWIVTDRAEAFVPSRPLRAIVRDVELATIRERLRQFGYHRSATAESLGITRVALWAKLRGFGDTSPRRRRARERAHPSKRTLI